MTRFPSPEPVHAAKRSVYEAMSNLLGSQCEAVSSAILLKPSSGGKSVSGIDVSCRIGIRRLRSSTPVAAFSFDPTTETPIGAGPRLEALNGNPLTQDLMTLVLSELCNPTVPDLKTFQQDGHTTFALSDASASLHRPVTVSQRFII